MNEIFKTGSSAFTDQPINSTEIMAYFELSRSDFAIRLFNKIKNGDITIEQFCVALNSMEHSAICSFAAQSSEHDKVIGECSFCGNYIET